MVLLGIPPLACRNNLRCDRLLIPLLGNFIRDLLRNLVLLVAMCEDRTAVLCADVGSLAVLRRGIMHAVEEFQQGAVADDRGVKGQLNSFGVYHIKGIM